MVDTARWLVQHSDHRQWRLAYGKPRPQESGGDTIHNKYVGASSASSFEDTWTVDDGHRKGTIGERHELELRRVTGCELAQTTMEEVASGEAARVAERYQGG